MNVYDQLPQLETPTAVALGLFDGVHRGHCAVLHAAVASGLLPVAFTFRTERGMPEHKRGARLLLSDELKQERLELAGMQALVEPEFVALSGMSPQAFVREVLQKRLCAKIVVCGQDFRFGQHAAGDVSLLDALSETAGFRLQVVGPVLEGGQAVSSSRIRKALEDGRVEEANQLLGYRYYWRYPVVYGFQNGRSALGFPTINQDFPAGQLIPKIGVYASAVAVDGRLYAGVTNIGVKPTVHRMARPLAETHIIGYDGDLYGEKIRVELLNYLRPEKKFPDFAALIAEIGRNKQQAMEIFKKTDFF